MKIQRHNELMVTLAQQGGHPINKVEIYGLFNAPCALTWNNCVEGTQESANAGDWISIGQKGQCQILRFPNGESSAEALYVMSEPLTYTAAAEMMAEMVGEAKVAKLVVDDGKVSAALAALAEGNPGFDANAVTVNWYRANRRYMAWRVPAAAEIRKTNWGEDAWTSVHPTDAVLVLNPGVECYGLKAAVDLPGWYSLEAGFDTRGEALFALLPELPEGLLEQFSEQAA